MESSPLGAGEVLEPVVWLQVFCMLASQGPWALALPSCIPLWSEGRGQRLGSNDEGHI